MNRLVLTVRTWLAYSLTGLVLATFAATGLSSCRQAPPPPPPPPEEPEVERIPIFTQQQFDALLYGMTYPQAVDILGAEAGRQESTYHDEESEFVAPYLVAWYYWENEDGSYIKLGFIDKKLAQKEAENLPPE